MFPASVLYSTSVASHTSASILSLAFWRTFLLLSLTSLSSPIFSQNFFANPGFEDINICTEYTAPCEKEGWFYIKPVTIPVYSKTAPPQLTGRESMAIPMQNMYDQASVKQLVYTMLLCPLEKNKIYRLSFYLNTLNRPFYKIDIGFSKKEPATSGFETTDILRAKSFTKENSDEDFYRGWRIIQYDYTATGDERFFITGNISGDALLFEPKHRMNTKGMVYYFIDDIKLRPLDNMPMCISSAKVITKLYAQNYRHTDKTVWDEENEKALFTDTLTVPSVFFETDKAILKPVFKKLIDSLALSLINKGLISVMIEGHTDNAGAALYNLKLSAERAISVRDYFLLLLPGDADKINAIGKGELFPVTDNKTKIGMAKNRRVNIILTYTKDN